MPQTRQNGIQTPIGSDAYNHTQDLAKMADTTNTVIVCANQAQRDELTPYAGMTVIRLDLGGLIQFYVDGAWRENYKGPYREWWTQTTFTLTEPATSLTRDITFPSGRFSVVPNVTATKQSGQLAAAHVYVFNKTTTGCSVGIYSPTPVQGVCPVALHVTQATPSSAIEPVG